MPALQREVTISLDEDMLAELERENQSVSAQVNVALRAEIEHRRRHRLLKELLDRFDQQHGPVDEALIGKYVELLR